MVRKNSNARGSIPPWALAPRASRISGIHARLRPRLQARRISASFSWIYRLEPLEVVLLTNFNCDLERGRLPDANTVRIKFIQKNRHPVPEPAEHWDCWTELRDRLPQRDWSKAERLLRALALDVVDMLNSGKRLEPSKLRREVTL